MRVGVEHELLTRDSDSGSAVAIERVRRAVAGSAFAGRLCFEPGGQVEINVPCESSPTALARRLFDDLRTMRALCADAGIELLTTPVDLRSEMEVPLQLVEPRYLSMEAHFDRIGPAGRVMMRRTAATQVCLDWWPGQAGLEQWRLLLSAGPLIAAAFARATGAGSRLATWLAVDPDRTAFDDRLLHGDDPIAAYTEFARRAAVFVPGGDADQHLTTLFPPVRPRGRYIEVRFPDVQEEAGVLSLVSTLACLMYDRELRLHVLRMLSGDQDRIAHLWAEAAAGGADVVALGRELVMLSSRSCVRWAPGNWSSGGSAAEGTPA